MYSLNLFDLSGIRSIWYINSAVGDISVSIRKAASFREYIQGLRYFTLLVLHSTITTILNLPTCWITGSIPKLYLSQNHFEMGSSNFHNLREE